MALDTAAVGSVGAIVMSTFPPSVSPKSKARTSVITQGIRIRRVA